MKQIWTIGMLLVLLCACNHPQVPDNAKAEARLPRIYPDYTDVTIPCNICPLNFAVQEASDDVVARFTYPGGDYTYGDGDRVLIDENEWRDMLEASKWRSSPSRQTVGMPTIHFTFTWLKTPSTPTSLTASYHHPTWHTSN